MKISGEIHRIWEKSENSVKNTLSQDGWMYDGYSVPWYSAAGYSVPWYSLAGYSVPGYNVAGYSLAGYSVAGIG